MKPTAAARRREGRSDTSEHVEATRTTRVGAGGDDGDDAADGGWSSSPEASSFSREGDLQAGGWS